MLEIRVSPIKFQMLCSIDQTPTIFDNLLQTNTCPLRSSNCSFGPRRVDHLISFTSIFGNLLDASSSAALDGHPVRLPRKYLLILQVSERDLLGFFHQPVELEEEF